MLHLQSFAALATMLLHPLSAALFNPGSTFSLVSLACALAIATARLVQRRRARGRRVRLNLLVRVLFPRRLWFSASTRADLGFLLFNAWIFGLMFGWALLSASLIGHGMADLLARLGPSPFASSPHALVWLIGTPLAYLAYEFGYWIDHYLSHKVPILWSFHKVHHTAEVLTPLTVFRVHPIESVKLANILALTLGATNGLMIHLFGTGPHAATLFGQNAILIVFVMTLAHLQHSHAWICFDGRLGRLILSPAHHQIHHSADPTHFGKNLGSFLGVCDWAFGTLHVPQKTRPALTFGVPELAPHTVAGGLIAPFADAYRQVTAALPSFPRPKVSVPYATREG
jgi:sterol desaturase/sphingolipid hydroxylase (fatty acid hydroxylase superfamily)